MRKIRRSCGQWPRLGAARGTAINLIYVRQGKVKMQKSSNILLCPYIVNILKVESRHFKDNFGDNLIFQGRRAPFSQLCLCVH